MTPLPRRLFSLALIAGLTLHCANSDSATDADGESAPIDTESPAVAEIDGKTISQHDLDEWTKNELLKAQLADESEAGIYQFRREFLDALLAEQLLGDAAEAAGLSVKEYVVGKDAPPITEDAISVFYQENAAGLGGTIDQWHDRIKEHLDVERYERLEAEILAKLRKEHGVRVLLEVPRVEVAATGAALGPEAAPVTIVEFSDYQCPFCRKAHLTLTKVLENYPEQVRLVYRHYALPNHSRAKPAANAAECAGAQGKYWEYHDQIFAGASQLSDSDLEGFANGAGLDLVDFRNCYHEQRFAQKIQLDQEAAIAAGVTGTPAFFINGRMVTGSKPYEEFAAVIEEELAEN